MYTYNQPLTISYGFGSFNFVSAAGTYKLKPPSTRLNGGRVEDIHVRVTTLFTQVTTPAYVRVGISADHDKYAELNMGAAAANAAYNAQDIAGSITGRSNINLTADGVTDIDVRVVAPTGGSPAGVGYLDVVISWWA
jgi:hypothetical protein